MDYFTRVLNASPFSHMWFLSILLQFYMIWPLLFGLYRLMRKRKGWLFAVGTFFVLSVVLLLTMPLCYGLTSDITRCYYGTDTRIEVLVLGATGGFLVQKLYDSDLSLKKKRGRSCCSYFSGSFLLLGSHFYAGRTKCSCLLVRHRLFYSRLFCAGRPVRSAAKPDQPAHQQSGPELVRKKQSSAFPVAISRHLPVFLFSPGIDPARSRRGLLLILILTTGTNRLLSRSFRKKEWRKRPVYLSTGALTAILCMAGIYSLAVSEQSKMNDQQQLALRLEENEKSLQASHTASKESNNLSVPDTKDYTGSGNSRKVELEGVVLVGDSVMLSASDQIRS